MRYVLFCLLWCLGHFLMAQDSYRTNSAQIVFDASTPLEDIHAVNQKVNAILTNEGEFAALLLVTEFNFKKKLMQEHFNENYMESDRFPKAYFKGKIMSFDPESLDDGAATYKLKGELTIHGVTREIETGVSLESADGGISLESEFKIRLEDHDVKIPRILFKKIAEEVDVKVNARLMPQ